MTEAADKTQDWRIKRLEQDVCDVKEDIKEINGKIGTIKDNHLAHIQSDMNDIKITQEKHNGDLGWLKKFFWIIATATIGGLIAAIGNLIVTLASKL